MRSLFISHGSPALALEPSAARDFFKSLASLLGNPKGIVCVSAHWLTRKPTLTGAQAPNTIHDFYGFPDELYHIRYPARGAPDIAAKAANLILAAGMDCVADNVRGLDHGVWAPLCLIYPDAEVPIVQLSIQPGLGTRHHVELGRALAPLTSEGILLIASGGVTHNLSQMRHPLEAPPPEWVVAFDRWLHAALTQGRIDDLIDYRSIAPYAAQDHPSEEHLLPLMVAVGAADGLAATRLHGSYTYGVLRMAAYGFDVRTPVA
jgi:4,5-DOPA dioxygenase extradiol